jgi:ATP-dependent RNA helicase DBP3
MKERKEKKQKKSSVTDDPTPPSTSERLLSSTAKIASSVPIPTASQAEVTEFLTKHSITIHTPDDVSVITPVLTFDQLDIPSDLQSSFEAFKEPTPIQACTWPLALQGLDVVGIAETGR